MSYKINSMSSDSVDHRDGSVPDRMLQSGWWILMGACFWGALASLALGFWG